MEAVNRLVRSLRTARATELPADQNAAFYMLMSAVMQNQYKKLEEYLAAKSGFEMDYNSGTSSRTLLHVAANVGAYECLCLLLQKGASVDFQDRQGVTPLQVAARNGYRNCISKLLEFRADVSVRNNEGMTALHWLASNGRTELLNDMAPHITNVDVEDWKSQTPLHVACLNGHKSTVLKLLDMGANLEKEDVNGCTPLFFACSNGHGNVVQELISRGSVLKPNREKVSPLKLALQGGYGEVCSILTSTNAQSIAELVSYCLLEQVEFEKACSVLTHLCSCSAVLLNSVLTRIAEMTHTEGLLLLSPSSDCVDRAKKFIRSVRILCCVFSHPPADQKRQSRTQSFLARAASVGRGVRTAATSNHEQGRFNRTSTPTAASSAATTMMSLWSAMEGWLDLVLSEIKAQPALNNENACDHADPSAHSDLQFVASALKRTKPAGFERSQSNNSAGYEALRLSQPAVQVNINRMSIHDIHEDSAFQLPSATQCDDGGASETVSPCQDLQGLSCMAGPGTSFNLRPPAVGSSLGEHRFDSGACGTGAVKASSDEKEVERKRITSTSSLASNSDVVEAAADRLCASIRGYYLYCQTPHFWEKGEVKKEAFRHFIERHDEVLKLLVARKPSLIFDHFNFLLDNPLFLQRFLPVVRAQPFEERRRWFYDNLYADGKRAVNSIDDSATMMISRGVLLTSSCSELSGKNTEVLKKAVSVRFMGEDGVGAGVTREWLDLLVNEVLNPDCARFTLSADGATFQPNSYSDVNPDHLNYFHFAGRIMGLAVYHQLLINAYFTRSFYKHILGIPVNYSDVESIDPGYATSLQWILDHDVTELGEDIPFSVETEIFGESQEIELKPNGRRIMVTEENKVEYVNLAADMRMTKGIRRQLHSFLDGFFEFIPHPLVSLFNEYELELIMSGLPDIDLNDWMKNTSYQAGYDEDTPVIKWFWEIVGEFPHEKKVQLLQFATGTSRVPWGGFSCLSGASGTNQLFTISRSDHDTSRLPNASTCFNTLKLPEYESKAMLKSKLETAISCGSLGFEFA